MAGQEAGNRPRREHHRGHQQQHTGTHFVLAVAVTPAPYTIGSPQAERQATPKSARKGRFQPWTWETENGRGREATTDPNSPRCRRLSGGSDGDRSSDTTIAVDTVPVRPAPPRRRVGTSGRASYQQPRARKLDSEDQSRLHAAAAGRSLRSLGAEFGISHEAVRSLLRTAELVEMA
jgi:hypothetical protein